MTTVALSEGNASGVYGDIPKLQIVSIEDWFKGINKPVLPRSEHLPSAVFSSRRRSLPRPQRPDAEQPELALTFIGDKAPREKGIVRHFNPSMVKAVG
jgi:site-specific DNA-methyltransferase (adenine-specific)